MTRDHSAACAFIDARMRAPFAWWRNDCVTFAARAARAQTRIDYLKRLGLKWSDARTAAAALASRGGLEAAVDGFLPRIAPAMAHRGDIGLVRGLEGRDSLVVIEGDLVVGPGLMGLVRLPRAALAAAWSIDL